MYSRLFYVIMLGFLHFDIPIIILSQAVWELFFHYPNLRHLYNRQTIDTFMLGIKRHETR